MKYSKTTFKLTSFHLKMKFIFACLFCSILNIQAQTEFEPPKLTCVRSIASQTELNWDLPLSANPCFSAYEIYASNGNKNGPYSLQASVNNPTQTSITINLSTGNPPFYYFYIVHRGTCNNPSPIPKKTSDTLFSDKPTSVAIKKVTVINNQIHVHWEASTSPEVIGYFIYNNADGSSGGFNNPDTVYGKNTTTFIDNFHHPKSAPITYAIRAFYSCQSALPNFLEGSITPPDKRHSSIRVNNQTPPDSCSQSVSINWSPYLVGTSSDSVLNYEIQTNNNHAGFHTQASVAKTTNNHIVQQIPYLVDYCIRIKANLISGDSSFSNELCFDSLRIVQTPKTDYIRFISIENGNMLIEYMKDTLASPPNGNPILYRSADGLVFTPLNNTPIFEDETRSIYQDNASTEINPANNSFTYMVRLNMSCGNTHFSDTATTLRVGLSDKGNNKAVLTWTGFEVQNIQFQNFVLEKIVGIDTNIIGTYNRNEISYTENQLFDYRLDSIDEVCYRVTANYFNNNDNAPRTLLQSHSNIVCIQPVPKAFVPQAFAPEGNNKTFKPFLIYAIADNYSFQIYDRWYHLIYTTNNQNDSWDGTFKGAPAPLDGYLYVVKFRGKNGQDYESKGTVMLVR
ncbi:MAG TPA: gliding motility-associated C-terminal domain-containing protein [Chitinophagales bacterium]|jgi:gliding motility-associated-like protein|nr:gliding motility-associated C-terminal domain-containing protein [Chitinophagales bacterium]HRB68528.1 gliding motility-associated C-terminal domain-containing protein [Chitinophagales bacterium]